MLQALDAVVLTRMDLRPVLFGCQDLIKNFLDQRRLSAPGYAGDTDQFSKWEVYIDSFQVVLRRTADDELMTVSVPPHRRDGDLLLPAEILAGDRLRTGAQIVHRSCTDYFSAVDTGPRTDVDDVVGSPHGLFVMLHHDQGISQIAQAV